MIWWDSGRPRPLTYNATQFPWRVIPLLEAGEGARGPVEEIEEDLHLSLEDLHGSRRWFRPGPVR
jgi:hypothetical protein